MIPQEQIDQKADENEMMGNLANDSTDLTLKTPFLKGRKNSFYPFDGRERIEIIVSILRKEIDFENMTAQGVIVAHFPLHKDSP